MIGVLAYVAPILVLCGAVCTTVPLAAKVSEQSLVALQARPSTLTGWLLSCKHGAMVGS